MKLLPSNGQHEGYEILWPTCSNSVSPVALDIPALANYRSRQRLQWGFCFLDS